MEKFNEHKQNIIDFAVESMVNYQRMYFLLSNELDREEINEHTLFGYHSMAYSAVLTMKSYYIQNDILSHYEFDVFFEKAHQFSEEFTCSRETNHSMQWTFGYYNELVRSYNALAGLLNLNTFEVPE